MSSQPNDGLPRDSFAGVSAGVIGSELPMDDAQLVERWRAGDSDAGGALIERHYDAISRFFRTKTQVGADDLVQRTFLLCSERLHTFEGLATFRAFLFGIARNVLLEHLRARSRDGRAPGQIAESAVIDLSPGLTTIAYRRAEQRVLVAALQRIPLDLQLLLELYYWEELSVDELARVLEVPPGTIKSRLHRARTLLREAMTNMPVPESDAASARLLLDGWAEQMRSQRPSASDDDGGPS